MIRFGNNILTSIPIGRHTDMLNFACRTKEEHLQVIDFIIFFLYILTTITSNKYLQLDQISSYCLYMKNNKGEKMKTYEQILKKARLVGELTTLAYESDDYLAEIDGLLNSALKYVPIKVLKEWKQDYLKNNKENA